MFLFFQKKLWFLLLFSDEDNSFKTISNYKPPNNKKTTGLAYDEKIDLVLNSIKNGEINIGIKAVIDRGIASVIQKNHCYKHL